MADGPSLPHARGLGSRGRLEGRQAGEDGITLERFDRYWDRANIHVDRVIYRTMPDSTVRLANLQAGAIDFVETVAASDIPAVRRNARLRLETTGSLGFRGIQFNIGNGEAARASPMSNPKVREAFDLAIDRVALNEVAFGAKNSARLPVFSSLDLSSQHDFTIGGVKSTVGGTVFNVYDRRNIMFYEYETAGLFLTPHDVAAMGRSLNLFFRVGF